MTIVTLRDVHDDDLPLYYRWQSDPVATHMAAFRLKDADFAAFAERWRRILADPDTVTQTILWEGTPAGNIGCFWRDGRREIGYWIDRAHWGKRIASQALAQLVASIDERPVHAAVVKDNVGSCRVLEKAGFVAIGQTSMFDETRGAQIDEVLYELR